MGGLVGSCGLHELGVVYSTRTQIITRSNEPAPRTDNHARQSPTPHHPPTAQPLLRPLLVTKNQPLIHPGRWIKSMSGLSELLE